MKYVRLVAWSVLAAASPAQGTLVVAAGGGGQYADLPPAVAAAAPGTTILVRPGRYTPFSTSKGLSVLGDPGAVLSSGDLAIANLPAGQRFVLAGLVADSGDHVHVVLTGDAGRVHLDGIVNQGAFAFPGTTDALTIKGCAEVTARRCVLRGIAGATIADSTVVLSWTEVYGQGTGPALSIARSRVDLLMATVIGPTIRNGAPLPPGIAAAAADVRVVWGSVMGGNEAGFGGPLRYGPPFSGTRFAVDDRTYTRAAVSPSLVRPIPAVIAIPRNPPDWDLTAEVTTGTASALAISLLSSPVPTPFGAYWLDPATAIGVAVGPSNPPPAFTLKVPAGLPPGTIVCMQAASLVQGRLELSPPDFLTFR